MSPKPRDSLLIIRDILGVAVKRASKTEIVYRSNINFVAAEKYITRLLLRGMLEEDSGVQGSLLAMDNATGDVLAMVGGRDFNMSQFSISPPNIANLLTVDDATDLEFQFTAKRSG